MHIMSSMQYLVVSSNIMLLLLEKQRSDREDHTPQSCLESLQQVNCVPAPIWDIASLMRIPDKAVYNRESPPVS